MAKASLIRLALVLALFLAAIAAVAAAGLVIDLPLMGLLARGLLLGVAILLVLWLAWKGLGVFLWRVGRRLAFSYFLIGVLPIPMGILLMLLNGYLLSGYFLGHLYRDGVGNLQHELRRAAESGLSQYLTGGRPLPESRGELALAYYRDGVRVGGDTKLPARFPIWLADSTTAADGSPEREAMPAFVARADGSPTLAATAIGRNRGVLAVFKGDVEQQLTRQSDVWVELLRPDDPRKEGVIQLSLGDKEFPLKPPGTSRSSKDRSAYFGDDDPEEQPWSNRPILWWGELTGPLRSLEDGSPLTEYMLASLNGRLATVYRHLFSGSAEVDTAIWGSLIAITGLLSTLYLLAFLMAFFMIFTLSRAVNRLSRATEAVRRGQFSARIPVRRRDQIGELQRSFNEMAANLELSVLAEAQKELLEKELQIARDLQQSLLPTEIPTSESVEFSTLFQPSAAIGGDYFDILRIDEDHLVVVIADVSGHGLPTGLRMAMLKAALVILVEEGKPANEILRRLSIMVRSEQERHFFVTATIAVIDLRTSEMAITNAGHPPTYLLRDSQVREILLPGSPLGALGETFGEEMVSLIDGDVVVWLSDGLIEATNERDEPFGYERVKVALAGPTDSAAQVRDRLLAAASRHSGEQPTEDDMTLVAMRYRVPAAAD
jgi:serine phosphatase RsbU (regulator of sigma subunit)